eukprot:6228912-Amphidinium_carterae.1
MPRLEFWPIPLEEGYQPAGISLARSTIAPKTLIGAMATQIGTLSNAVGTKAQNWKNGTSNQQ